VMGHSVMPAWECRQPGHIALWQLRPKKSGEEQIPRVQCNVKNQFCFFATQLEVTSVAHAPYASRNVEIEISNFTISLYSNCRCGFSPGFRGHNAGFV